MLELVHDMEHAARARDRERHRQLRMELQAVREADRAQKAYERATIAEEKERKRLYVEARIAETSAQNEEIEQAILKLGNILSDGLKQKRLIDFESMFLKPSAPSIDYGQLLNPIIPPNKSKYTKKPPTWWIKWLPLVESSYKAQQQKRDITFSQAMLEYEHQESQRQRAIDEKKAHYNTIFEQAKTEAEHHNQMVRA